MNKQENAPEKVISIAPTSNKKAKTEARPDTRKTKADKATPMTRTQSPKPQYDGITQDQVKAGTSEINEEDGAVHTTSHPEPLIQDRAEVDFSGSTQEGYFLSLH